MDGRPNCRNKAAFSNVSGLKRVFEKLYFLDGLVWTIGLTVEIKVRFQIYPEQCGRNSYGSSLEFMFSLSTVGCHYN